MATGANDFQRRLAERLRADEAMRNKALAPARRSVRLLRATLTEERRRIVQMRAESERTYQEARASGASRDALYWLTLLRVRL